MPPHLARMGYRTTVPPNIRFIFFVASPEREGLCSVTYWLVLQQNILRNFVNCGRNMTATLYHYTNRNAKFAKLRLTSTSVALLVTSLTKSFAQCNATYGTTHYRGVFRTGAMGALAPAILKNWLLADAIFGQYV